MLIKLPEFKPASAVHVMQALSDKLLGIAAPMRQSMSYDQQTHGRMGWRDSTTTGPERA